MIIYRPHRGGLAEAMQEAQTFSDIEAMKAYIVQHFEDVFGTKMFEVSDIVLDEDKPGHDDPRINWHDTRYVCVKRMGGEVYNIPQCIGMWATRFD